jgi:hypothetical protein
MVGVGKFRLVLMLLILCLPVAARVARHQELFGPHFSLPGWIMRACHPRSAPRGSRRRGSQRPSGPRNALPGEQSAGDYAPASKRPAVPVEATADASHIRVLPVIDNSSLVSDPAFLCIFLI